MQAVCVCPQDAVFLVEARNLMYMSQWAPKLPRADGNIGHQCSLV